MNSIEPNDTQEQSADELQDLDQRKASAELEIKNVIDKFLHRVLDIEDCAKKYIPAAIKSYNDESERLMIEIAKSQEILNDNIEKETKLLTIKNLRKTIREIERHNSSSPVTTLEKSLFINLFAVFDKYVGDIVAVLYRKKPELYKNINREIQLSEALNYESIEELRNIILDKEIETLRRKSYSEQFKDLDNRFSIKLTKFEEWPYFIERAQRRNLFTHCDGIVSKQYLDACSEAGCKLKEGRAIGDQLEIGAKYLFQSCMLIGQVGIMLGQTLWRKTQPDEIEKADSHLSNIVFDYLHMEHWRNAIAVSKFAVNLPKISTEELERIFCINYAIALSAIKDDKSAIELLNKKDWSATTYDFKLAYAILNKKYIEAKELMIKMGEEGELISELAYHDWPLFREFRDSDEFFEGYEQVYGYKYSSKLSEIAETQKVNIDEEEIIDQVNDLTSTTH